MSVVDLLCSIYSEERMKEGKESKVEKSPQSNGSVILGWKAEEKKGAGNDGEKTHQEREGKGPMVGRHGQATMAKPGRDELTEASCPRQGQA